MPPIPQATIDAVIALIRRAQALEDPEAQHAALSGIVEGAWKAGRDYGYATAKNEADRWDETKWGL